MPRCRAAAQLRSNPTDTSAVFDVIGEGAIEWADMGEVYDRVVIGGDRYDFPKGRENFRAAMKAHFPGEEAAILRRNLLPAIRQGVFTLRLVGAATSKGREEGGRSAQRNRSSARVSSSRIAPRSTLPASGCAPSAAPAAPDAAVSRCLPFCAFSPRRLRAPLMVKPCS